LYIACVDQFWFIFKPFIACWVLSKCSWLFPSCFCIQLMEFSFTFAWVNMWVWKFDSDVSGLCKSKLGYIGQDPPSPSPSPSPKFIKVIVLGLWFLVIFCIWI
jgi:hypothetical protein